MTVSSGNVPKITIEAIVQRIFAFRQITPLDRRLLKSAMLAEKGLDEKDHSHINRVCQGIRNGLILVVE
ncbi:hypothetical protein D0A34_01845 [Microcoleus vaginatus PCC 9802]|uniref:hypothetical protein n=1 Tax=Microcoleus vaginatus TaxID=119532 RepID=UPI00020D1FD8|nr:hypothetical protein MicvaDRAFT_4794 [Microcoleus vaginatus FGP-2]UNU17769.1 hypothetical protein D0A34_01845 [Microcoleus vaginatus PCC 9802]